MGTKHTPGPWIVQVWPDDSGITVAQASTLGTVATIFPGDREREMPDARLIAAAPELLAALQKAVRFGGLFPDLRAEAEAVIAKATS